MSSRCLKASLPALTCSFSFALMLLAGANALAGETGRELRVCADPDNLPYSHEDESGFENRIARLVADDMGAKLTYYWLPLRRGFVRKTMGENHCDVFIGVPAGFERVLPTRPYYRSSYVFVYRKGEQVAATFAPEQLRGKRIGVQLVGNDLAATPPGYALARAGATDNVIGYTIYGEGPAARRMIDAIASRQLDMALIWGPQAGYFARHAAVPMDVAVAQPPSGLPVPFAFSIAMGVRKGNAELRRELDGILERRRADIDAILAEYAVPMTDAKKEGAR